MKTYYIYKITNTITGKIYIGKRLGSVDDKYMGSGKYLKNAIKKYGIENFTKDILLIADRKNINEFEQKCISLYESTNPDIGYNIALGGDGGDMYQGRGWKEISDSETYEQRLEKKRQRDAEYWTVENRKKLGDAIKQKQWTGKKGAERKKKFSERYKGANNPSAKTYKLISPEGVETVIKSLASYCRENNLVTSTVRRFVNAGKIVRKSKKDTSFHFVYTKQFLEGWEIIEIKEDNI